MLTKDLLHFRRSGNRILPRWVDPENRELQSFAEALLERTRQAEKQHLSRGEWEEELELLRQSARERRVADALLKLIADKTEFAVAPSQWEFAAARERLFLAAAELLKNPPPDEARFRQEAARRSDLEAFAQQDIYGDLPENEQISAVPEWSGKTLLERYNLAQVQGLLLYTYQLELTVWGVSAPEWRRFARQLKFHRLVCRIESRPGKRLAGNAGDAAKSAQPGGSEPEAERGKVFRLTIDGPYSMFAETRKYALQLATFFPAILLLRNWKLHAELQWSDRFRAEERRETLSLNSEECVLRSTLRDTGVYVPEEFAMFEQAFGEKCTMFAISSESEPLRSKAGSVIFPDFVFTRRVAPEGATTQKRRKKPAPFASETPIALELFHRHHATLLQQRLEELRRHPELPLLLGIDRSLGNEAQLDEWLQGFPELRKRCFCFRDFPGVDRVKKILTEIFS